jgi:hypothetical protein
MVIDFSVFKISNRIIDEVKCELKIIYLIILSIRFFSG